MRIWIGPLLGAIAFAAAAIGWTSSAPAQSSALRYFYCYASDGAGTVYMSDMHEVGPVSERRSYGDQFSQYLARQGKVPAGAQAYCVMRPTEREIARGQLELPERCDSCGDAKRFNKVAWLRDGKGGAEALLDGKLIDKSVPPKLEETLAQSLRSSTKAATGVVVLGNTETGAVLIRGNWPDEAQLLQAVEDAKADQPNGWSQLLSGKEKGWGAVVCVRHPQGVMFGASSGQPTEGEAIKAANAKVSDFFNRNGGMRLFDCAPRWHNAGQQLSLDGPGVMAWVEPPEPSIIDTVKGKIRSAVTTDGKEPPDKPCTAPVPATSAPPKPLPAPAAADKPCAEGERKSFINKTFVCMCVRG